MTINTPNAPEGSLFERLQGVQSLICQMPKGSFVERLFLSSSGEGAVQITATFGNGREAILVLKADGRLLRGGVTTSVNEEEVIKGVRSILDEIERELPPEGKLPATIHLYRTTFLPDEQVRGTTSVCPTGSSKVGIDPTRLPHLNQFREFEIMRFQFREDSGTFDDYLCVIYPGGFLLEKPKWKNAAFAYEDKQMLKVLKIDDPYALLSDEQRNELEAYVTQSVLPPNTTKKSFKARGAEKFRHFGAWQERIANFIRTRLLEVLPEQLS